MIELSRTQDEEVGDGTTSVIVLGKFYATTVHFFFFLECEWGVLSECVITIDKSVTDCSTILFHCFMISMCINQFCTYSHEECNSWQERRKHISLCCNEYYLMSFLLFIKFGLKIG